MNILVNYTERKKFKIARESKKEITDRFSTIDFITCAESAELSRLLNLPEYEYREVVMPDAVMIQIFPYVSGENNNVETHGTAALVLQDGSIEMVDVSLITVISND